VINLHYFSDHK